MIISWLFGLLLIKINRTLDWTFTMSSMIDRTLSRSAIQKIEVKKIRIRGRILFNPVRLMQEKIRHNIWRFEDYLLNKISQRMERIVQNIWRIFLILDIFFSFMVTFHLLFRKWFWARFGPDFWQPTYFILYFVLLYFWDFAIFGKIMLNVEFSTIARLVGVF